MTQASAAGLPPAIFQEDPKRKVWLVVQEKLRPIYPFIVMAALWEAAARQAQARNLGQLFPTLEMIAVRAWELVTGPLIRALTENPDLPVSDYFYYLWQSPILWHTLATAWRLPVAFAIGGIIGLVIGILMGRFSFWESFFVPLIAVLLPIPALAWTPIAILWFGLGDQTVIIIIAFATFLPIAMAVWTGVKTVNPVWIRAAQSMNASKMTIFRTVVLPGSLPMIMSGMRIGLARAWRAGVGAEAFAGLRWGLSAGIFDAQEFLDIAFMMVALTILGLFGYILEKVLFQPIESRTVIRWGLMEAMGGQDKKV
ncbi:MAG: ABC transporter permease subunit [bacterium]|nr:ABC transporter permease subunit [bacterium]